MVGFKSDKYLNDIEKLYDSNVTFADEMEKDYSNEFKNKRVTDDYLYTKIENDYGLSEADSTLKYILNKYDNLFLTNHTESQKLYILSLTLEIMMSTCKSAVLEESILSIDEMKPVLFAIIRKIFDRIGENKWKK